MSPLFRFVTLPMLAAIVAVVLLSGCTTRTIVRTVEVKVPVYIVPAPPAALAACGADKAGFRFYAPEGGGPDVVIKEKDQLAFQKWIESKSRCIRAWQEWAK